MVKVGDSVPSAEFHDGSPFNKVNSLDLFGSGDAVIVGVPAAFSPDCTDTHVPGFMAHDDIKKHKVYVIAVNDAFVMKAWEKKLDAEGTSGIKFLADPAGEFTQGLDLMFDAEPFFGNKRGKRYVLKLKDGKVTSVTTEDDPSKVTVTAADKNL